MTNELAHEYMENEIRCVQMASNGICTRNCNECDLVKENQPLLEAYGLAILALEKQLPKKPKLSRLSTRRNKLYICPNCSNQCLEKEANERQDNMYCWNCGQALDWEKQTMDNYEIIGIDITDSKDFSIVNCASRKYNSEINEVEPNNF